jgi:hypothetical protein
MRQVITVFVLLFTVACSQMEFETAPKDSVMSAYVDQNYWAADTLSQAYYYGNFLFISAKSNNENIILKVENPVVGNNSKVEIEYFNSNTKETSRSKSGHINLFLDVLDTVNAQPSIVNGTFNGQFELNNGRTIKVQEGKIKNALTQTIFCENTVRSVISANSSIGGKWELVKIINRKNSSIQNPPCNKKVLLNIYDENYMPAGSNATDNSFEVSGPQNNLRGDFNILETNKIEFVTVKKTNIETTNYNNDFESLVFESISAGTSYYINNSLMHLESKNYVAVFYRRS